MSEIKKINSSGPGGWAEGFDADYELVAGTAYGYREWAVNPPSGRDDGLLYPLTFDDHPWTNGVNTAACGSMMDLFKPGHRIEDCSHGFYSYHDINKVNRLLSFASVSTKYIVGVVEVLGHTIVGDRGFRSSKAKIVALYYPRRFDYRFAFILSSMLVLFTLWFAALSAVNFVDGDVGSGLYYLALAAFDGAMCAWNIRTLHHRERERQRVFEPMFKNYPSVKIYRSKRKIFRDFPPTQLDFDGVHLD